MGEYINENERKQAPLRHISGNFKRFLGIVNKFLRVTFRNKTGYFWTFGYPLLFMIMFTLLLKGATSTKFKVAIINYDSQPTDGQTETDVVDFAGRLFYDLFNGTVKNVTDTFTLVRFNSNGTALDEAGAYDMLRRGNLDAVIVIPGNFSECIANGKSPDVSIKTVTDPVKKGVIPSAVQSILNNIIMQYSSVGQADINVTDTTGETTFTSFDLFMPGIIIIGVTISLMNVSMLFAEEKGKGLMQRLDTTPVPRWVQLLGGGAAQLIFSSIQIVILMLLLLLFGVQVSPNANWGLAFLDAFLTIFMCIGIGLIIAGLVKNYDSASGLSWVIILPLQFFSGALVSSSLGGAEQIFPTWYAVQAMRNILTLGANFMEVWPDLMAVLISGIAFFLIGLLIFQKKTNI